MHWASRGDAAVCNEWPRNSFRAINSGFQRNAVDRKNDGRVVISVGYSSWHNMTQCWRSGGVAAAFEWASPDYVSLHRSSNVRPRLSNNRSRDQLYMITGEWHFGKSFQNQVAYVGLLVYWLRWFRICFNCSYRFIRKFVDTFRFDSFGVIALACIIQYITNSDEDSSLPSLPFSYAPFHFASAAWSR